MFKSVSVGALVFVLTSCVAPETQRGAPRSPEQPAGAFELPLHGKTYGIDTNQSELRILVYRAGPLARLGHNHVMVNRALRGSVTLMEEAGADAWGALASGAATFWMDVPATAFVVDEAQARSEEGPDFAAEVSDEAKSGTLQNMLSAAVLDAGEFPVITVKSIAISGLRGAPGAVAPDAAALIATVAIGVAGHESTVDAAFTLHGNSTQLSASGSVDLRQSTLGLTPYSLMLGALQVQDSITIKFRIIALALGQQDRSSLGRDQHGGGYLPERHRYFAGR